MTQWSFHGRNTFSELKESWSELVERYYSDHPLLSATIVACVLRFFADDKVKVAVAHENHDIVAMAVLQKVGLGRWQTFAPSQLPMTLFVHRTSHSPNDLLASLQSSLPGPVWMLSLLHYDCAFYPAIDSTPNVQRLDYYPTMTMRCDQHFDDYWQSRSKNLRKSISRYQRKIDAEFPGGHLTVTSESVDMPGAVQRYGEIESAGWKGSAGTALHKDNVQGAFYSDLLSNQSDGHRSLVFYLHFGDKLVATRLAVASAGIMVILKTTYDETFAKFAPGRVLLKHVLQYACSQDSLTSVEFYTKADADQLRWATSKRMIHHYNVFPESIAGTIVGRLKRLKSGL